MASVKDIKIEIYNTLKNDTELMAKVKNVYQVYTSNFTDLPLLTMYTPNVEPLYSYGGIEAYNVDLTIDVYSKSVLTNEEIKEDLERILWDFTYHEGDTYEQDTQLHHKTINFEKIINK